MERLEKQPYHFFFTQVRSKWWNGCFQSCPCGSSSGCPVRAGARLAWWADHGGCGHEHLQCWVQDHGALARHDPDAGQFQEQDNWKDWECSGITAVQALPCFLALVLRIFDASVCCLDSCPLLKCLGVSLKPISLFGGNVRLRTWTSPSRMMTMPFAMDQAASWKPTRSLIWDANQKQASGFGGFGGLASASVFHTTLYQFNMNVFSCWERSLQTMLYPFVSPLPDWPHFLIAKPSVQPPKPGWV